MNYFRRNNILTYYKFDLTKNNTEQLKNMSLLARCIYRFAEYRNWRYSKYLCFALNKLNEDVFSDVIYKLAIGNFLDDEMAWVKLQYLCKISNYSISKRDVRERLLEFEFIKMEFRDINDKIEEEIKIRKCIDDTGKKGTMFVNLDEKFIIACKEEYKNMV